MGNPSGVIEVTNQGGTVVLDEAYAATMVSSYDLPPTSETVISGITPALIDNMFIVNPPEEVKEAVDQALIDQVVDQIMRDIEMGDQTAIEELLMSCPEDKLRGFLSEVDESQDLDYLKKLAGI